MKAIHDMVGSHPEWEGRVQSYCISIDYTAEAPQNYIDYMAEEGWENVKSYWSDKKDKRNTVTKLFRIDGYPTCYLIHKGKVLWRGHPRERELADDIAAVIARAPLRESSPPEYDPRTKEIDAEKVTRVRALLGAFNAEIHPDEPIECSYRVIKTYDQGRTKVLCSCYLDGSVASRGPERFEGVVQEIKSLLPYLEDYRVHRD
jgi:hypothetical protein